MPLRRLKISFSHYSVSLMVHAHDRHFFDTELTSIPFNLYGLGWSMKYRYNAYVLSHILVQ